MKRSVLVKNLLTRVDGRFPVKDSKGVITMKKFCPNGSTKVDEFELSYLSKDELQILWDAATELYMKEIENVEFDENGDEIKQNPTKDDKK